VTITVLAVPYGPRIVANSVVKIFEKTDVPTELLLKILVFWDEAL
jgi:hypothetical protein